MSSVNASTNPVEEIIPDKRDKFSIADYIGPVVVFMVFIGAWYLLSSVVLPEQKRFLLPTPHKVIQEGFFVWHSGERRGLQPILMSLWDSAKVALLGLGITIVIGMSLAVLMSSSRWLERATWPYLVAVQSAPVLALTPLIRALIDGTQTQRLLVVVLIVVLVVFLVVVLLVVLVVVLLVVLLVVLVVVMSWMGGGRKGGIFYPCNYNPKP